MFCGRWTSLTQEQETNHNIPDEFSAVLEAVKTYHKQGYNILPILPRGAKYPKKGNNVVKIKAADGKSAEGFGWWHEWIEKKQDSNFINTFHDVLKNANNKLSQYLTAQEMEKEKITTLNLALVCGDVSGDEEYGSGVADIDGLGQEIYDEALLLLESQNEELAKKLDDTPQTRTPSGGIPVHFQYPKKDFEKQFKSLTIYTGKNRHEEIEILANGRYVLEPPSEGYVAIKHDFHKIAKLSKKEFNQLINCMKMVCAEQRSQREEEKLKTPQKLKMTRVKNQNIHKLSLLLLP